MLGDGLGRRRELKTRDAELTRTRKLIEQMRQLPADYSHLQPRSSMATCRSSPGRLATSTRLAFSRSCGLRGKS